ncbi:MAG: hypothetical protein PHS59_01305 [Paludibacter sp.]|nr:hypothetical protein [Paludibacter sp.]
MENYLQTSPMQFIEEGFQKENQSETELKFSLGNGYMQSRAHFEEFYSGESELGSYIDGVYKNTIEGEEKCLSNLPNWTSLHVFLNSEMLDLARCEVSNYRRMLDLENGLLERSFEVTTEVGRQLEVKITRFLSLARTEIGAIRYTIKSLNFVGRIAFLPVIDGDFNAKKYPDKEPEWNVLQSRTQKEVAHLWIQTRKTNFQVCGAVSYELYKNNSLKKVIPTKIEKQKIAGFSVGCDVKENDTVYLNKYFAVLSSLNHPYQELTVRSCDKVLDARNIGWDALMEESKIAWNQKWDKLGLLPGSETNSDDVLKAYNEFLIKPS